MTALKSALDKMAIELLKGSDKGDLADQIDAFKAVAAYYAITLKPAKNNDEKPAGPTFDNILKAVRTSTHSTGGSA